MLPNGTVMHLPPVVQSCPTARRMGYGPVMNVLKGEGSGMGKGCGGQGGAQGRG